MLIPLWSLPYALVCGNCMVCKASPRVPMTLVLLLPNNPAQLSFTAAELDALAVDDGTIDRFVAAVERALTQRQ